MRRFSGLRKGGSVRGATLVFGGGMALAVAGIEACTPAHAEPPPRAAWDRGWETVAGPADGPAQAVGGPALGCLGGGVALPADDPRLVLLRPQRNRFWGHPVLIAVMDDLAGAAKGLGMGPLLVGDAAQPRGGPMPDGHRSHQMGLDVDIWFAGNREAPYPETWVRQPTARTALTDDGRDINPAVLTPTWEALLRIAALDPRVERMFVNPAIKAALCSRPAAQEPEAAAWMAKLRPWWGHDSHVHVRLGCPAGSPDCQSQKPVPPGTGCDESLDWWRARETRLLAPPAPRTDWPPALPETCAQFAPQSRAE